MSIATERDRAAGHVIDRLGEAATYTAAGISTPTRVIVTKSLEESGDFGGVAAEVEDMTIPVASVPSPKRDAVVVLTAGARSLKLVKQLSQDAIFTRWRVA